MKLHSFLLLSAFTAISAVAQTAKSVLDKTASQLSRGCVVANFTARGAMGNSNGNITVQGKKFVLTSPQARIWFDGKTEWSLAQGSGEVNVTTPTAAEIAGINPINFIYLYKQGYNATLADKGAAYEVHLTTNNNRSSIKEAYISINKSTHTPQSVRIRTNASSWSTINITSLQNVGKKNDSFFRFNSKDFPKVEVIDLR